MKEVEDYNSFGLNGEVAAAYLKTTKSFIFPIKTYQKMDIDPMNSVINVLSKLEKGENLAIQYLVRSAKRSWHAKVRRVVFMIHRKNSVSLGLKYSHPLRALFQVNLKNDDSTGMNSQGKPLKRLSAVEEEMVKTMEEKNLKAGLDAVSYTHLR